MAGGWRQGVGFITGSSELHRPHVQSWRSLLTPAQPPSASGVKAACGHRHRDQAILTRVLEPFAANVPWTQRFLNTGSWMRNNVSLAGPARWCRVSDGEVTPRQTLLDHGLRPSVAPSPLGNIHKQTQSTMPSHRSQLWPFRLLIEHERDAPRVAPRSDCNFSHQQVFET